MNDAANYSQIIQLVKRSVCTVEYVIVKIDEIYGFESENEYRHRIKA